VPGRNFRHSPAALNFLFRRSARLFNRILYTCVDFFFVDFFFVEFFFKDIFSGPDFLGGLRLIVCLNGGFCLFLLILLEAAHLLLLALLTSGLTLRLNVYLPLFVGEFEAPFEIG
jgi:hypothetical protein